MKKLIEEHGSDTIKKESLLKLIDDLERTRESSITWEGQLFSKNVKNIQVTQIGEKTKFYLDK